MKYREYFSRKGAKVKTKAQRNCLSLRLGFYLCAFARNNFSSKLALTVIVIALATLPWSGCGGTSAAEDKSKIKVGIVFDIGGKDDRSFNAAAWQGVQRAAKDLPIVLRDIEPGTPNAIEPAMRAFAERNYDLIIGVGFAQAPIMEQVAKDYPHIQFAIIDGVSELPNVASLVFKEHEGSYLVGILAA